MVVEGFSSLQVPLLLWYTSHPVFFEDAAAFSGLQQASQDFR